MIGSGGRDHVPTPSIPIPTMRVVFQPILRLFSSVTFGISLMALLFLYMSVGSAGILYPTHPNLFHPDAWVHAQFRQWRPFEMTEFEWFHWWPFDVLVGLLALTLIVTTLRRIPFKPVNYGVWMIHSGIVTLIVGSLIYFGTKIEGDAPVPRRAIVITIKDADGSVRTGKLLAMPGNRTVVGKGASAYEFQVTSNDPAWELRSGPDNGKRAYSVNLLVQSRDRRFIRQVIAGFPQYTEDMIFTQDKAQPVKRAMKETGKPLVDEQLSVELVYEAQPWFYLKNDLNKAWALYVRRPAVGDAPPTAWVERPISGLPLYNDYVGDTSQVFSPEDSGLTPHPIQVAVPSSASDDPAKGVPLEITAFLRYAELRARWREGDETDKPNPVVIVGILSGEGEQSQFRLQANNRRERSALEGNLVFRTVRSEAELEPLTKDPTLVFRIPAANVEVRERVRDAAVANPETPFKNIGPANSGYSYRVSSVQDDLPISGQEVSVAILEMRTPKGEFRRWAFSDKALSRDVPQGQTAAQAAEHGGQHFVDDTVQVEYEPGNGLALVTLVAGPEPDRLRLVDGLGRTEARVLDLAEDKPVDLGAGRATLTVTQWMPRAVQDVKPYPVPQERRMRDARELFSMVRLNAPGQSSEWLKYHQYVFDREEDVLRRSWLDPSLVTLADGSQLEVLFSRQRERLPTPIALEEFVVDTNIGGLTSAASSIRNYTSMVRFGQADGSWGPPQRLSVNEPVEHDGYWFFQSQWDPPDDARGENVASAGLNYTVLGVGNRQGVYVQLAGCMVAVLGMAYAFYYKPVLKRRQKQHVLEEIALAKTEGRAPHFGTHYKEHTRA